MVPVGLACLVRLIQFSFPVDKMAQIVSMGNGHAAKAITSALKHNAGAVKRLTRQNRQSCEIQMSVMLAINLLFTMLCHSKAYNITKCRLLLQIQGMCNVYTSF